MSDSGILVFDKVTKEYARRQPGLKRPVLFKAVDSLDLEVHLGELLLISGRSGAGKSTIAQLMVGLTKPTAGTILFDGYNISDVNDSSEPILAGRRQIVFQNPHRSLSPRLTIAEIIMEPAQIIGSDADARELLELVGLPLELMQRYPSQLSAGQRQRVALARALSTDPDLLVLDEPTSSLDPLVTASINKIILGQKTNRAVVLISHDPIARKAADRIVSIDSDRLFP